VIEVHDHRTGVETLADLLIRRDGAAWVVADDPSSPIGYSYLVEVVGRDGVPRTGPAHKLPG
jgi:hypothetical protein